MALARTGDQELADHRILRCSWYRTASTRVLAASLGIAGGRRAEIKRRRPRYNPYAYPQAVQTGRQVPQQQDPADADTAAGVIVGAHTGIDSEHMSKDTRWRRAGKIMSDSLAALLDYRTDHLALTGFSNGLPFGRLAGSYQADCQMKTMRAFLTTIVASLALAASPLFAKIGETREQVIQDARRDRATVANCSGLQVSGQADAGAGRPALAVRYTDGSMIVHLFGGVSSGNCHSCCVHRSTGPRRSCSNAAGAVTAPSWRRHRKG